MRKFVALVLLVLLPLQFSWGAVASYCGHEVAGAGHPGHHAHQHPGDAGQGIEPPADADAQGDKAPGATDLDCGHCHAYCSVMLTPQLGLPDVPPTAPPGAAANEAGSAHAPTRPERPQWPPLA